MSLFKVLTRGAAIAAVAAVALSTLDTGSAPAQSGGVQAVAAVTGDGAKLGVYDPNGAFGSASSLTIEHIYLPLIGVDLDSLRQAGGYAVSRNRELLVTVEPWSWDGRSNLANEEIVAQVVAGKLDKEIVSLCTTLGNLPTPTIIRWGHEMEAQTRRYAWTLLPPEDYIAGYRHFVTLCRQYAPTAQYMWSPMGEPGLVSFYPGDDVVDLIGLSVFALQPYEREVHGTERNVADIAQERYRRVVNYQKPIYIAELGCDGDESYVEECIEEFRTLHARLPELAAVVYFNDLEPAAWPRGYGRPDWRLPADAFAASD